MERHLKAVLLRPMLLTQAQVPFAKMPGAITCALQHFSHRDEFGIKIPLTYRIDELFGWAKPSQDIETPEREVLSDDRWQRSRHDAMNTGHLISTRESVNISG